MSQSLINTAAVLYRKKEREEWENLWEAIKTKPYSQMNKVKGFPSVKIWFWALKRWGNKWPDVEYNLRNQGEV